MIFRDDNRRCWLLGLVIVFALIAAACGDDDDTTAEEPAAAEPAAAEPADEEPAAEEPAAEPAADEPAAEPAAEEPTEGCTADRVGGEILVGQFSMPTSVDPAFRSVGPAGGTNMLMAMYDTLMRFNGETGEIEPYVAESYEIMDNGREVVLTLRPDVTFGNGNPLNAEAVVAAHSRYVGGGTGLSGYGAFIGSIEAVDDLTVRYTMPTPWGAELLNQMAQTFGMIADAAVAEELGDDFGSTTNTGAGVGPYELTVFNPPTEVVLEAKDNYWQGPVCIRRINNETVASGQQAVDSFRTGQYDQTMAFQPQDSAKFAEDPVGQVHEEFVGSRSILIFNTDDESAHFNDQRVRQAVSLAMDVELMNERGYGGALIPHKSFVPPGLPVAQTPDPPFDPDRARELVEEVKAETGWDGSFELTCSSGNADPCVAAAAILNNVGFNAEANSTYSIQAWVQKVSRNHDYQTAMAAILVYNNDFWDSYFRYVLADTNYTNLADQAFKDAFAATTAFPIGSPEYDEAIAVVAEMWEEIVPTINIGSAIERTIYQDRLKGIEHTFKGLILWGKAYLDDA